MLVVVSILLFAIFPLLICTKYDVIRVNGRNEVLYGVCAGIARRLGLTASFVRLSGVLLGLFTQTIPLLALGYVLLSISLEKDNDPDDSLLD